ncbi:MAG: hypothetical protein R3C15_13015 [Thermoleophilia bacterium]
MSEHDDPGTRVGVSGHRHLHVDDALVHAVDDALARCERLPGPWTLVEGLAIGADALVAQRALARAGWSLDALLPLPLAEYAADFSPDERSQLDALVARASRVAAVDGPRERPACYAAQGAAVVHASDLLLALWNGAPARGPGGTAEVVACARDAGRRLLWLEVPDARDDAPRLPVLHEEGPWA